MERKGINALIVTGLALFMTVLDNLVVTTALPSIRRDLGATVDDLQWFAEGMLLNVAASIGDLDEAIRLKLALFAEKDLEGGAADPR